MTVRQLVLTHPYVLSQTGFSIERAVSGASTSIVSDPGDAILVYLSIYGKDTVKSVGDSVNDTFYPIVSQSMAFGAAGAQNGFAAWMAVDVVGGSAVTVTATLQPRYSNSVNDSAVVVADVTGVSPQPLDAVGPVANSSSLPGQQSAGYAASVAANATDLVVSAVGARNFDGFIAQGNASRVFEQVGVYDSTLLNAMTTAVFQESQGSQNGVVWVNATSNKSSAWIAGSVALAGGGPPPPAEYWLTFAPSGLASGTPWTVSVGNSSAAGVAPAGVRLAEPNGTYQYLVAPVPGYAATPASGTAGIAGGGANVTIVFSKFYTVFFVPAGLPSGAAWSVAMGNQTASAKAPQELTFQRPDGTYPFSASATGFIASPAQGAVVIDNAPITATLEFAASSGAGPGYPVVFSPAGLPADRNWSVEFGNVTTTAGAGTQIEFSQRNGTYAYTVSSPSGYLPDHAQGTLQVNGKSVTQNVNFKLPPGNKNLLSTVTFVGTGLPANTSWSLTFAGKTYKASAPAAVNTSVQNGSYAFQLTSVTGYVEWPSQGTVYVTGGPVTVTIVFTAGADVQFTSGGLPGGVAWAVTLQGVSRATYQLNHVDFGEPAGAYNYTVAPVPGFSSKPSSGTVSVGSSTVTVKIQFSPVSNPTYIVTIPEVGLSPGTPWNVSAGATWGAASAPSPVVLTLASGSYSLVAGTPAGYRAVTPAGSLLVGKTPLNLTVTFALRSNVTLWPVTFSEVGATRGAVWSVTFDGAMGQAAAPSSIGFSATNGTHSFTVRPPAGSTANLTTGQVTVVADAPSVPVGFTADIQHVVAIVLENNELKSVLSAGAYEHYLWAAYGHASNFYGACHQSKPEYTAMTSGRAFTCGAFPVESVTNLADLLEGAGLSWAGYFESMPTPCNTTDAYPYTTFHNPFLDYADIVGNTTRCDGHVLNSAVFNASVDQGTLPTVSFYLPNEINDCHDSTIGSCDQWLKGFLSPLLNSTSSAVQALMNHTAVFVLYDEGSTNAGYTVGGLSNSWCKNTTGQALTVCGGQVDLTVVSPYSVGTVYAADATDYNFESTIEWLFGLGSDGGYDGTANFPSMDTLFSFG